MRRLAASRAYPSGLLTRPPAVSCECDPDSQVVNLTDQLKELADLYTRGLISRDEFDDQKVKVLR